MRYAIGRVKCMASEFGLLIRIDKGKIPEGKFLYPIRMI